MPATLVADSLLAVDFGSVNTRASLIDVAGGAYRVIATGVAPTTVEPPFANAGEGMRHALDELRAVTGRAFLDESERLIMPERDESAGVDGFLVTASAGDPLSGVIVGLLPDVSIESARRAAASTYLRVAETIGLADRRREDQQIDAILRANPDLIMLVGGTEGGASDAVLRLAETVGLAMHLIPDGRRPRLLFAGNSQLAPKIAERFAGLAEVTVAANLRPSLDLESIDVARRELAALYQSQRVSAFAGYAELVEWTGGRLWPTAHAFGQVIRFLSRVYDPSKGVLGVEVGSASTTIAAAFSGLLALHVRPDLGVGHSAPALLESTPIEKIERWLPVEMSPGQIRDYLHNKGLRPGTVPHEPEEVYLEHAIARQAIRAGLRDARAGWPPDAAGTRPDLLPWFEPILGGGAVLARAPRPGHAALILLDALQPTGITTLVLDAHGIAPALGAAAWQHPAATVQVLDSGAFINLGVVVSAVGRARPGDTVVRVRLSYDSGDTANVDVRYGALEVLPLPAGQAAKLHLQPLRRFDVGFGAGRPGTLRVAGGAIGLILDARGRPIFLPPDADKRRAAMQKWIWDMGG